MYRPIDPAVIETAMHRAIELASREHPHPNPRVGAVVLDAAGAVVGEGAHVRPGQPHAEQLALEEAGPRAREGTVVVTLEPCAHHGNTPPCAEALIAAGVARVVAAVEDPDPRVTGRGLAMLRRAGIEVEVGVADEAARRLDPGYFHHRTTGRPHVGVVLAMTLDGQAGPSGDGWAVHHLSGAAREDVRRLRSQADAVMVGAGYLQSAAPEFGAEGAHQPRVVVVAGHRPPPISVVPPPLDLLLITPQPVDGAIDTLAAPTPDGDRVDLVEALTQVAERGLLAVQVEGGRSLVSSLQRLGLVDEYRFYIVPRVGGGVGRSLFDGVLTRMAEARAVEITGVHRFGTDLRIDARAVET